MRSVFSSEVFLNYGQAEVLILMRALNNQRVGLRTSREEPQNAAVHPDGEPLLPNNSS